jgi:hypothetical protein
MIYTPIDDGSHRESTKENGHDEDGQKIVSTSLEEAETLIGVGDNSNHQYASVDASGGSENHK